MLDVEVADSGAVLEAEVDGDDGGGRETWERLGAGDWEALLLGMVSLSPRLCRTMEESAATDEDLADLGLYIGEGGGMLALVGVMKEGPAATEGGASSSRPSNWGMKDMLASAAKEADLEDRGRDPGVWGGSWVLLDGVWGVSAPGEELQRRKLMQGGQGYLFGLLQVSIDSTY